MNSLAHGLRYCISVGLVVTADLSAFAIDATLRKGHVLYLTVGISTCISPTLYPPVSPIARAADRYLGEMIAHRPISSDLDPK